MNSINSVNEPKVQYYLFIDDPDEGWTFYAVSDEINTYKDLKANWRCHDIGYKVIEGKVIEEVKPEQDEYNYREDNEANSAFLYEDDLDLFDDMCIFDGESFLDNVVDKIAEEKER